MARYTIRGIPKGSTGVTTVDAKGTTLAEARQEANRLVDEGWQAVVIRPALVTTVAESGDRGPFLTGRLEERPERREVMDE